MMKKILFLFGCAAALVSCEGGGEEPVGSDPIFLRHIIVRYADGDYGMMQSGKGTVNVTIPSQSVVYYNSPDIASMVDAGADTVKFLRIAERNGDLSFNRTGHGVMAFLDQVCFADHFEEVHLACTGASVSEWDAGHPVGARLDDAVKLRFSSYADFVRSGYADPKNSSKEVEKHLSELTPDDLNMICSQNGMDLVFDDPPAKGIYELELTFLTTTGVVKKSVCTYDAGN